MNYYKKIMALTLAQLFTTPLVLAQQTTGKVANQPIESITITGSRINRTSAQMSPPTTIVDAATIELSGAKNIGDLIHQMPALPNGIGAVSSSDGNGGNKERASSELVNLRGLIRFDVNSSNNIINFRRADQRSVIRRNWLYWEPSYPSHGNAPLEQ